MPHDGVRVGVGIYDVTVHVKKLGAVGACVVEDAGGHGDDEEVVAGEECPIANRRLRATDRVIVDFPSTEVNGEGVGVEEFDPFGAARWVGHEFVDEDCWGRGLGDGLVGGEDEKDEECANNGDWATARQWHSAVPPDQRGPRFYGIVQYYSTKLSIQFHNYLSISALRIFLHFMAW